MNLHDKHILVTGGYGFLGSKLVQLLRAAKYQTSRFKSEDFDLTKESNVDRLFKIYKPDIVIHLAAMVGGIGLNMQKPGSLFYDNLTMGVLCQEYARQYGVEKFVGVGTVCAYPKHTPVPFKEEELWNGYPESTNAPYGLAKKMLLVQSQAYRQEYGFNGIFLLPVNMYGPGDNFNPTTSHVIPALIRKYIEAQVDDAPYVTLWGTGKATREFIYVDDAAMGIKLATENYDEAEPVNIGTGIEISIVDLATKIANLVGYKGETRLDPSKPDGQPRRCLDVSRAQQFGFTAQTDFDSGLKKTVDWYKTVIH